MRDELKIIKKTVLDILLDQDLIGALEKILPVWSKSMFTKNIIHDPTSSSHFRVWRSVKRYQH